MPSEFDSVRTLIRSRWLLTLLLAVQWRGCPSYEFLRKVTADYACAWLESLRSIDVSTSFQSFFKERSFIVSFLKVIHRHPLSIERDTRLNTIACSSHRSPWIYRIIPNTSSTYQVISIWRREQVIILTHPWNQYNTCAHPIHPFIALHLLLLLLRLRDSLLLSSSFFFFFSSCIISIRFIFAKFKYIHLDMGAFHCRDIRSVSTPPKSSFAEKTSIYSWR